MSEAHIVGIDFGTESARGVLIDVATGVQIHAATCPYRHGILNERLPSGRKLPPRFALHAPADYEEALGRILASLGSGRRVLSVGVACTASSPMPAAADGSALADAMPDEPHAYVKLWKHGAAQPFADAINAAGADDLAASGGRLNGEALLPKAMQVAAEAPQVWERAARFIEAGDWIVWRLTGGEARSMDLACFKAHYTLQGGYPSHLVPGLAERVAAPKAVGTPAGTMTRAWLERTGIEGPATVAVAVIDSHAVLPAVGALHRGALLGVLGTSSGFLAIDDTPRALPPGADAAAFGAALPEAWCCEAGQAAFGDALSWFVRTFPLDPDASANFRRYNAAAMAIAPGSTGMVGLDWLGGNRVPFGDASLSGLLAGVTTSATAAGIYRTLVESLSFGSRLIVELLEEGGIGTDDIVLASGLARSNPFLVQTMSDVMGRPLSVAGLDNATAVGAAIHGAVAAGLAGSFAEGFERFGSRSRLLVTPAERHAAVFDALYGAYRDLAFDAGLRDVMHRLARVAAGPQPSGLSGTPNEACAGDSP